MRLIEHDRPEYLAVAFDTGKTFRDDIFPAYKGTGPKCPMICALRSSASVSWSMLSTFRGLKWKATRPMMCWGQLRSRLSPRDWESKIITGDRDLLQLVDDRIIVSLAGSKISEATDYTEKGSSITWGCPPAR